MKAGVIGYPIQHSKSPIIHRHWLSRYGLSGSYEAIEIKSDNLAKGVESLIDQGFTGFNVTLPHKENILSICHEIEPTAQKIGAVNTVVIKDGKLYGKNTDSFGFLANIKEQSNFDFRGKTAFILGAGGAAKAVLHGLLQEGIKTIYLANRTKERAQNIAEGFGAFIKVVDWQEAEDFLNTTDLLVNTTSLGMIGQPPLILSLDTLKKGSLVTDIVYKPLDTDLLKSAEKKGFGTVTGIGMLLHQARPAFESWTGILPDVDETLVQKVLGA